jgi:hypothetical protein
MPDLYEIGALGAFLGLVGWALADGIDFAPHPTAALKGGGGCVGASDPSTALDVANKWGPPFGCPVRTLLVIASIESGYRAQCSELSPRAMARGGAFGMWQQTRNTAAGHARALASSPDPDVQATLRKWTGRGPDLFDPDLCGMFAARQLGQATAEFGDDHRPGGRRLPPGRREDPDHGGGRPGDPRRAPTTRQNLRDPRARRSDADRMTGEQ